MAIVAKKKRKDLLVQGKVLVGKFGHYFHFYLWGTKQAMMLNVPNPIEKARAYACYNNGFVYRDTKQRTHYVGGKKIGEVHFSKDDWNLEVVAHELCHILLHRFKCNICPNIAQVFDNLFDTESICYDFGRWVSQVHRALWEVNPNPVWRKEDGS